MWTRLSLLSSNQPRMGDDISVGATIGKGTGVALREARTQCIQIQKYEEPDECRSHSFFSLGVMHFFFLPRARGRASEESLSDRGEKGLTFLLISVEGRSMGTPVENNPLENDETLQGEVSVGASK